MIVYGDHPRATSLHALHAEAAAALGRARTLPAGLERHAALVEAFILAAETVRALADAALARSGIDAPTPAVRRANRQLLRLARAVTRSWDRGFARTRLPRLPRPAADPAVLRKPAEGFAFYALYPEAYCLAARSLARPLAVLGLRGIGVALAAMAAAGTGARPPLSARPQGHPFERRIAVPPEHGRRFATAPGVIVADEGPGLSGSSMAAAVSWLAAVGVSPSRITLMPSHRGPPGPAASLAVSALWAGCAVHPADFETHVLPRLPGWVERRLGLPVTGWEDLSGGRWREGRALPADPARERHKFRATTASGRFLVKFAGLGGIGRAKLERAGALAEAGFSTQPHGLAHGFLIERWIEAGPAAPALEEVARYLAFRARAFPGGVGADRPALLAMASANIAEGLGEAAAAAFRDGTAALAGLADAPRILTDSRLHRAEWLRDASGRIRKTDALDHAEGHDLIGAQPPAWDIAGAAVELGLDSHALARRIADLGGPETPADAIALARLTYAAFQLGLWTMAGCPAEAARYATDLRVSLA